ncbi:MAG TPA: serine/threonine-protein kinase [Longimicrobiaceae bacterium]|nr:serine/threonine-protein kinase [Longimicrobiaceae bacterium]
MGAMDRDRWRVLGPLLDHALELSAEERESWLGDLRESSPELAEEITTLLSGEYSADRSGFLAEPLGGTLEGLTLGAYTLVRPLGQGGMGSVWLARRSDGRFEGRAAVKLLNLGLLSPAGEARFRREGSVLARLTHPGIARLLDAGVTPGGQPYLVLEYVDGQRIDRYVQERGLSTEARVSLVLDVLAAVGHAHANLIVHRDLKPSNILVTPGGAVKLLDFGIAKLLNEGVADAGEALTAASAHPMTPEYAAPEQLSGGAITTATDVYAAGVLLYLLLSGRHPTAADRRASADAVRAIRDVEPAPLGLGDLDTVLGQALRKDPHLRYRTVEAFADDLGRCLRHETVSARRDSLAYRARKFVRRHRAGVTTAAAVLATLVAATAFSLVQMRNAQRQRDAALAAREGADAQVEFQQLLFSSFGDGRVTMREIVDQGGELLRNEYGGHPAVAARIAETLADQYAELGAFDREAAMLTRAESLAVAGGAPDALLRSRCALAVNFQKRGLTARASALLDSIQPRIEAAAPVDEADCLSSRGEVELLRGQYDSAVTPALRAERLVEGLGMRAGAPEYIGILNLAANALENVDRGREALGIYRRLAAVMDSTGRDRSSTRNVIRNNIGIDFTDLGEMTTALPILHEAVEEFLRTDTTGYVHPAILINYCKTALFLARLDSAGTWYERLYRESLPTKDPAMEDGAYGMAEVELARGRLAEAERWIAEEKRVNALLPDPRPATGLILDAALTHARGDAPGALAMYARALRIMGYDGGKRPFGMRPVLVRAAEAALDARAPARALEYARAAHGIATADSLTETRSAYVGEARLLEARALLASGDTAAARTAAGLALAGLRYGAGADHPRTRQAAALLATLRPRPKAASARQARADLP